LQDKHGVLQAALQQTPSTQKFEAQASLLLQTAPRGSLPHEPFMHWWPLPQSLLLVQVVRHWFAAGLHVNGLHDMTGPSTQLLLPSQT
jgi:hypothetical protein